MYQDKNVLLIAGGGTLGMSTAKELLRLGCFVDILCPEDKVSDHERLVFHKGWAEEAVLKELITKKHLKRISVLTADLLMRLNILTHVKNSTTHVELQN